MLTLIHGDNQVGSRLALEKYKTESTQVVDAKNLTQSQIEALIQPNFLSTEKQVIILENPKIEHLKNLADTPGIDLVVWVAKTLSSIALDNKLWKILPFDVGYSKTLYTFIDCFFAKNLKTSLSFLKALKDEGIPHELVVGSLNRQVVSLLTFEQSASSLSPFQQKKLSQVKDTWNKVELRKLLIRLTQLDYRVKSGVLTPDIGLHKLVLASIG